MPVAMPRALRLGLIDPRDAVAAFERKHLLLPSFRWDDVYAQEHARGVAVAGVMKWDVLQAFADEIALTITAGGDLRSFSQRVQAMLEKKGMWGDVEIQDLSTGDKRTTKFDKSRLQLIFDINTRQAYSTGRWKRIEANKARQPFVMYRTMDDGRVRLLHSQWHGLVLPVENSFWDAHYPPNGWRCRCTAFGVSEKDIARFAATGMKIKREAPPVVLREYVNKRTEVITRVPRGIDPGFEYNPGRRLYLGLTPQEQAPGAFNFKAAAMEPHTRLPVARPIDTSMLMPKGLSDAEYLAAFQAAFDNKPVFTDVTGHTLLINGDFFRAIDGTGKVQKRGREQFIKLIALAIQSPDEIWMLEGFHVALQKTMLRRRYIARFLVDGDPKPVLAVLELDGKSWTGVTGYQAEADSYDAAMLVNARIGERVYARVK